MNNIFTKFFNFKKKLNQKEILFQNIKNTSDVKSIFNAISSHNEWSDIRYVGGCVRKILKNENYDDIDLATNLNPDQVKECLTINKIQFFETGIKHGTITARIGNQNAHITKHEHIVAAPETAGLGFGSYALGHHFLFLLRNYWRHRGK